MRYSYTAKNSEPDLIYVTRLRLIRTLKIDVLKSSRMYNYYMTAQMGIILTA